MKVTSKPKCGHGSKSNIIFSLVYRHRSYSPITYTCPSVCNWEPSPFVHVVCSLCYPHPYQYELDRFQPAEHQLTAVEPTVSRSSIFTARPVSNGQFNLIIKVEITDAKSKYNFVFRNERNDVDNIARMQLINFQIMNQIKHMRKNAILQQHHLQ